MLNSVVLVWNKNIYLFDFDVFYGKFYKYSDLYTFQSARYYKFNPL